MRGIFPKLGMKLKENWGAQTDEPGVYLALEFSIISLYRYMINIGGPISTFTVSISGVPFVFGSTGYFLCEFLDKYTLHHTIYRDSARSTWLKCWLV